MLLQKKQIVIMLRTDDSIVFGGYINETIRRTNDGLKDENMFLFKYHWGNL